MIAPPLKPQTTSHKPHLRSTWSANFPWCQCCGRTDRHHVRWGLCYICCDHDIEWMHSHLAWDVQHEMGEAPGQCRDDRSSVPSLDRLIEGARQAFMPYEETRRHSING